MNLPQSATAPRAGTVRVGGGTFVFEADPAWARLPESASWTEVAAVAADSRGRVFVFNRGAVPVRIFSRTGQLLGGWGEGAFARPHGIALGPDGSVYCTDDRGHTVEKFTPEGALLMRLGARGRPSETGAATTDFRSVRKAAGPFNFPTNVAFSPEGEIYVSDGYGNARVHKFSADGRLLFSWGAPGGGPGEFRVPHGIAVARDGSVWVADRENSRIQVFSPEGRFLGERCEVARPCQLVFDPAGNLYVAELGYRSGRWPWMPPADPEATGGRVSIFDPAGALLARWGGGADPTAPGDFYAPHGICVDAHGDVYVSETQHSGGGRLGLVSPDCHSLQKFRRIPAAGGPSISQ